jgi:hypothetical protein
VLGQRNHQIIVTLAQDRQQAQLSLELTEYTELFPVAINGVQLADGRVQASISCVSR